MFLKVIACEIAARELQFTAARSRNLIDLELLTQGYHDIPASGREEIQKRIDAVPAGKYDAIVLGYGLCSKILVGLRPSHTQLIIPRAHDCITFFLGSKERYQKCFSEKPGTYYYTSGWLECAIRRGITGVLPAGTPLMPNSQVDYEQWVIKYGADQANFLLEEMSRWTKTYSHGTLIDFEFLKPLDLPRQVQKICSDKGWTFDQLPGDLSLFQAMLDGPWSESDFLTVQPGQKVVASFDDRIIAAEPEPGPN